MLGSGTPSFIQSSCLLFFMHTIASTIPICRSSAVGSVAVASFHAMAIRGPRVRDRESSPPSVCLGNLILSLSRISGLQDSPLSLLLLFPPPLTLSYSHTRFSPDATDLFLLELRFFCQAPSKHNTSFAFFASLKPYPCPRVSVASSLPLEKCV